MIRKFLRWIPAFRDLESRLNACEELAAAQQRRGWQRDIERGLWKALYLSETAGT